MLDINLIKNDLETVRRKLRNKKIDVSNLEHLLVAQQSLKELMQKQQEINTSRNEKSKTISDLIKQKVDASQIEKIKQEVSNSKLELDNINAKILELNNEIKLCLDNFPNLCDDSVPIGKDETENVVVKKFMEPTVFNFEPTPHWTLAEKHELFKSEVAAKITGARFIIYYNLGAKLYRALQQFTLDKNISANYIEVLPPAIINADSLYASGQLPKFEEDLFKLNVSNYYLSPTAEVQLTSIYRDEIIEKKKLPIRLTANTPCFRSEAGSAGRDTRGAIRLHQFYKTELMCYSLPEESFSILEEMTQQAESILEALKLPYRRIVLCSGDTGFSSAKTYDIEVWLPSYNQYKEISSCSNCTDFQARRAKIRFKDDEKNRLVHTLNGSSLAIDRLWVAVVENYQNADGTITVPEALVPYMGGLKSIA